MKNRLKSFIKLTWHKFVSIACAVAVSAFTLFFFDVWAVADSSVDGPDLTTFKFSGYTTWDDVSDDCVTLAQAYVDWFNACFESGYNLTLSDDFFESAVDVPVSWFGLIGDIVCLSPLAGYYYYIDDDVLICDNDGSSPGHAGGGGRKRGAASGTDPVITSEMLKSYVSDWKSNYIPQANKTQVVYSYQDCTGTKGNSENYWSFKPYPDVYGGANGTWGNQKWTDFYAMVYVSDGDVGDYYSDYYVHVYADSSDSGVILHLDSYSLIDNTLYQNCTISWDIATYPYVSLRWTINSYYMLYGYKSAASCYSDSGSGFNSSLGSYYFRSSDLNNATHYLFKNLLTSSTFTPDTNSADDWGYITSNEPFYLYANQTSIDYDKIPDDYIITISGDSIYDYSITDSNNGDTTTIGTYIENQYVIPSSGDADDNSSDSSGTGSTSGNVLVGGSVSVGGDVNVSGTVSGDVKISADPIKIEADPIKVEADPIDINVNVDVTSSSAGGGSSGTSGGVVFDQDLSADNYYDWMIEQTSGFSCFMEKFFTWLPNPILIMLCSSFAFCIMARFIGR